MENSFITIDSESTKDIDDAFSLTQTNDGFHLFIAIANASSQVSVGSAIDIEALRIGATAYAGDRVFERMLPRAISEVEGSLVMNRRRDAFLIELRLNQQLQVVECRFDTRAITVKRRLSYDQIPDIIKDESDEHSGMLKNACNLGNLLLRSRRERGAMALYDMTNPLLTDEDGNLRQLNSVRETVGHIIVQEFMILANCVTAEYCMQNNIAVIFRNHQAKSSAPAAEELAQTIEGWYKGKMFTPEMIQQKMNLFVGKSHYESSCKGHYALNLMGYMHVTSPLRRYPDLINQRQIIAHLKKQDAVYTKVQLSEIAMMVNESIEKRKVERRDGFKQALLRTADRALNVGKLDNLADHEIVAALKIGRDAGYLPDVLVGEIVDRFNRNALTDKVIVALVSDVPLTMLPKAILTAFGEWLAQQPEKSLGLIGHGERLKVFDSHILRSEQTSKGFKATAVIKVNEKIFTSTADSQRKNKAEQIASAQAFMLAIGGEGIVEENTSERSDFPSQVNHKGQLLELCQKQKWQMPEFTALGTGAAHAMSFSCTVTLTIDDHRFVCEHVDASTKKQAETMAAKALLDQLNQFSQSVKKQLSPPTSANENPVGALQEYCQSRKLQLPDYQIVQTSLQPPEFHCCLHILTGSEMVFKAMGSSKKIVKNIVAKMALEELSA